MMHFKNHSRSGFSLIEAVIAIVIIGTLLSTLLGLQSTVFGQLTKMYRRVNRIFLVKKMLAENMFFPLKIEAHAKKTIKDPPPPTQLVSDAKKVGGTGQFEKFDDLYRIKVTGTWKDLTGTSQLTMVGFVVRPEKKKKKEA